MIVKELKKVIETLPDDFEIVISTDIGGNRSFNFRELKDISVDIGYSSKAIMEMRKHIADRIIQAYQKGAELGYNKANEWHKADILPSQINKVVLGYIKDYNSKMFCLVKWNGEWWYDARTYNERVKLIAWRRIEIPALPKEIKK